MVVMIHLNGKLGVGYQIFSMSDSIDRLNKSLKKLEELVAKNNIVSSNSIDAEVMAENIALKAELADLQKKYKELVATSEDVINELNNSIQVIDNYFKKQDANN